MLVPDPDCLVSRTSMYFSFVTLLIFLLTPLQLNLSVAVLLHITDVAEVLFVQVQIHGLLGNCRYQSYQSYQSCCDVTSCGTVALYGLFIKKKFLADHRATDFTLSTICGTPTKNMSHLSTVIITTKRFVRAESCG